MLRGKDPVTGLWRTAPAKQYPSRMCEKIADGAAEYVIEIVNQENPGTFDDAETEIAAFYTPLDPYNLEQVFGAYGQDCATIASRHLNTSGKKEKQLRI